MKKEIISPIRSGIIRAMSFDGKGNLIFNVHDIGLMYYNLATGQIDEMDAADINNELNDKVVTSLFIDNSGIIWIGTFYDGVIKIVSLINSFKYYNVQNAESWNVGGISAILEDSEGYLWMGTRFSGVFRLNRKTQEYKAFKQSPRGLSSNNILSILEVKENNQRRIWIGTDGGGLNSLDPVSGKIKVFRNSGKNAAGPSSNSVSSIIRYDRDHLLIGTRDRNLGEGLDVFNMKTGRFINMRYDPSDSLSLGSNNILKLFKDKSGTVWVGTRNGGLNKFVINNINAETSRQIGYFVRYTYNPLDPKSLRNNTIYSIHDDSKRFLWLGTNDGGLSRFDPSTGTFSVYLASIPERPADLWYSCG